MSRDVDYWRMWLLTTKKEDLQMKDVRVITKIELKEEDLNEFWEARVLLKRILDRHLDPVWTFKDKTMPDIQWEGVHFEFPRNRGSAGGEE